MARLLKVELHISYVQQQHDYPKYVKNTTCFHQIEGADEDVNIPQLNLAMLVDPDGNPHHFDLGLDKSLSRFANGVLCNQPVPIREQVSA